ncbi:MAG: hypothetical protein U0871_19720 [Gemmataceae bacterium]
MRTTDAPRPAGFRRRVAATVAACISLALAGCGNPSEDARQNRRVVDAVLTAVTVKSRKQLDKDAALWDKRLADGLVSERCHKTVKECIEKARSGDWGGAEDALYKFREADPFPK